MDDLQEQVNGISQGGGDGWQHRIDGVAASGGIINFITVANGGNT